MLAYALVGSGARTYRGGRWDGVVIKYIADSGVLKQGGGLEIEWQTIGVVMICRQLRRAADNKLKSGGTQAGRESAGIC